MTDEATATFAKAICVKANALRSATLTQDEQRELKTAISFDIRIYGNLKTPMISRKAQLKADELSIPIRDMRWRNQTKYDEGRRMFHLEHFHTVKDIRDACVNAQSEAGIITILENSTLVWILKDEDKLLNSNGQRNSRDDPHQAYRDAGIELLDLKSDTRQQTLEILRNQPAANFIHPKGCFFRKRGKEAVLTAHDALKHDYILCDPNSDEIVARYESDGEMVDDGWRIGS
jgi:hypothetical protein